MLRALDAFGGERRQLISRRVSAEKADGSSAHPPQSIECVCGHPRQRGVANDIRRHVDYRSNVQPGLVMPCPSSIDTRRRCSVSVNLAYALCSRLASEPVSIASAVLPIRSPQRSLAHGVHSSEASKSDPEDMYDCDPTNVPASSPGSTGEGQSHERGRVSPSCLPCEQRQAQGHRYFLPSICQRP